MPITGVQSSNFVRMELRQHYPTLTAASFFMMDRASSFDAVRKITILKIDASEFYVRPNKSTVP